MALIVHYILYTSDKRFFSTLSSQVLNFAQTRYSKAYEQYMKSLDYLVPFGDSTDLAWLYSHLGYFWFELGHFRKAARYVNQSFILHMLLGKGVKACQQFRSPHKLLTKFMICVTGDKRGCFTDHLPRT